LQAGHEKLKQDLMQSLFRFKKVGGSISRFIAGEIKTDLNISEISVLNCIKKQGDVHSALPVSKAAVSQILGSLEEKGYIERDIDRCNRRKITISLTARGNDVVKKSEKALDKLMSSAITHFGEAEIAALIHLTNDFVEFVESRSCRK
jgi:DNA-binding MarR family transcriptional regulator